MANATFEVQLSGDHDPVRVGDEVSATISVTPERSHDSATLRWSVGWSASGRRVDTVTVTSGSRVLGPLEAHAPTEHTVSFTVPPEGPVTYHGTLFHVAWFIEVSLEVRWATDPNATFPFEVRARTVRRRRRPAEEDGDCRDE